MYRLGIDLGGTNIAVGLVNEKFELIKKMSTPTLASRAPEAIIDDMAMVCKKLLGACDVDITDVESVGIASPGIANSKTGIIEYANNLPFKNFPIARMLSTRLGVNNIKIANDANAAALGEAVAGAARGSESSVMITLGTGVGGGVIVDGKLISGFNFAGGELGHMVIEADGVPCSCGRCG